jgi:hypothetical protein
MIPPTQEWTDIGSVFLSAAGRLELRVFRTGQWSVRVDSAILASGTITVETPVDAADHALSDPIEQAKRAAENAALEIGRAIVRDLGEWPE